MLGHRDSGLRYTALAEASAGRMNFVLAPVAGLTGVRYPI